MITKEMTTFSINTVEESIIFNNFLNEAWRIHGSAPLLPENYFETQYLSFHNKNPKLFYALVDLEITLFFMLKDINLSCGRWNDLFAPGKNEGGSVLDNFQKFHGKLEILEAFSSFSMRCRGFWDKYMGILILLLSPTDYEKFFKAKSRKKKFKSIAASWENFPIPIQNALIHSLQSAPSYKTDFLPYKNKGGLFPEPFLEIIFTWIEILDNQFRTPEAHGAGAIRKWSLSMLPIFESKDFKLISHWNIVNSMARGLRETLKNES